jgi:opacity protein-like surface antigen
MVAVGLVIGVSTVAFAGVQAGDTTITLSSAFTYTDVIEPEVTSWDITGRIALGRFLTNNFQLEGILNGSVGDIFDSADYYYGALLVRPNFHFSTASATVPYIGASVGMFFLDIEGEGETNFAYGGQAGIKQFVRDNVFVQVEGSYLRTAIFSEDVNLWRVFLGLGFKM